MKKIWKYLITIALGSAVVLTLLITRQTFAQTDLQTIYKDLCDAFFVPGIIIAGFGALVFCTNGGTFDMLAYSMIRFFALFQRDVTKVKHRTFYDYRMAQKEKHRSFGYMLVVGCVFIVVAVVFLVLYDNL